MVEEGGNEGVVAREFAEDGFDLVRSVLKLLGDLGRRFAFAGFGVFDLNKGVTEGDEDRLFRETDTKLALERANDVFRFVGTGESFGKESLDDLDFGVLRLC